MMTTTITTNAINPTTQRKINPTTQQLNGKSIKQQ